MALRVTLYDEPVLRMRGEPVSRFDSELADLVREMIDTMYAHNGIGLAAQQVGKALQVCVIDVSDAGSDYYYSLDGRQPPLDLFMPIAVINPELEVLPGEETSYEEGCLSFPDVNGDVVRPSAVRLKYQDVDGSRHVLEAEGILARCIQHEIDHLNGVLFIDRMNKKTLRKIERRLRELREENQAAGRSKG